MFQKVYLIILKAGIYLSLIMVFFLFKSMFFPYITSKQIPFNVLIEVLFVLWLAFIVKYPVWRPKKSLISIGLISFFSVLTLSCFTGVDFNLSFWGDAERMLGVFHLLHFLAYYFIIITIMKTWKDWRNFFAASVIIATLVVLYGLINNIQFSTLGNTAYLSGYVIFNIYFALILFFRGKHSNIKDNWLIWLYIGAVAIMASVFSVTRTRGAYVGLGASILVLLIYFAIKGATKKIKIINLIILIFIISAGTFLFLAPENPLAGKSRIINTVSQITPEAETFQTRLISWKAAMKDFSNHPLLGTGHGNFAISFDKYFDPSFYNYTRTETYFDRAHNNIIDITSTSGLLGLLTYLSILISAVYYLVRGYIKKRINQYDFILLISLIVAYFIQNLVIFDSFITYLSLMMTLGFIYYLSQHEEVGHNKDEPLNSKEFAVLGGVGIIIIFIIFQFNIKPFKMMQETINGQITYELGRPAIAANYYQKAFEYNTVLDRDSRQSFARQILENSTILNNVSQQEAKNILDYAISLVQQNVALNPKDSLMQTELAEILNIAAKFNKNDDDQFYFYSNQALDAINIAIESSSRRIQLYFVKAQVYETRGENDKAIKSLEYAASLNDKYYDSFCNLARYYFTVRNEEQGFLNMDKCIDLGGALILTPQSYLESIINYYWTKEDWPRLLTLYEELKRIDNTPKTWINLSKLYLQDGQIDKAIEAAETVIELDELNYGEAANDFITKVKANDYSEFLPQEDGKEEEKLEE